MKPSILCYVSPYVEFLGSMIPQFSNQDPRHPQFSNQDPWHPPFSNQIDASVRIKESRNTSSWIECNTFVGNGTRDSLRLLSPCLWISSSCKRSFSHHFITVVVIFQAHTAQFPLGISICSHSLARLNLPLPTPQLISISSRFTNHSRLVMHSTLTLYSLET